ncbi:MAG: GNAT family N-acetyltransferase [Ktedonobacterales bacterium]
MASTATTITIRPEREEDYPRVAELLSMGYAEPVTAATVRAWRETEPPERITRRLVAVAPFSGAVVGCAHALRDAWAIPGLFWLHVGVDPTARGRGIGARLFAEVDGFARERGATIARAEVRDQVTDGLRFAERHGFHIERHIFESTLDLAAFDEAPFVAAVMDAEEGGIRFVSLADLGDTEEARRKLHALNEKAALDVPGSDATPRPYEAFAHDVFQAEWYRPDGQIVAMDGAEWIGLSAVGIFPETRSAYNMMTGVLPAYRGRGIAQALKVQALRCARRYGAAYIRTNNDAENAPMLAVNRKLGYRPEPGFYRMRREGDC